MIKRLHKTQTKRAINRSHRKILNRFLGFVFFLLLFVLHRLNYYDTFRLNKMTQSQLYIPHDELVFEKGYLSIEHPSIDRRD
jgi:hypothetical protein